MANTKPSTSSAPRPAPVEPKPAPKPGIVHQGRTNPNGTAIKDGWSTKK
jgi:hypothetical protein